MSLKKNVYIKNPFPTHQKAAGKGSYDNYAKKLIYKKSIKKVFPASYRLAITDVYTRYAAGEHTKDFIVDRAEDIRQFFYRNNSIALFAEEDNFIADLDIRNIRYIKHTLVHADIADLMNALAMKQNVYLVG